MKCVKAVAVDGMAADVKTCMEVSHCLLKPFKDIDTDCGVFGLALLILQEKLLLDLKSDNSPMATSSKNYNKAANCDGSGYPLARESI